MRGFAAAFLRRAVRRRGRGFSSGADLKAGFEPADDGMPDIRHNLHELYHPIIVGVRRLEKPVIAAVHGPAVGIGDRVGHLSQRPVYLA